MGIEGLVPFEDVRRQLGCSRTFLNDRIADKRLNVVAERHGKLCRYYFRQEDVERLQDEFGIYGKYGCSYIARNSGLSKAYILNIINSGAIPFTDGTNKRRLISKEAADAFLDSLCLRGSWRTDEYLTSSEVARKYSIGTSSVCRHVKQGDLPKGMVLPSGRYKILKSDAEDFFKHYKAGERRHVTERRGILDDSNKDAIYIGDAAVKYGICESTLRDHVKRGIYHPVPTPPNDMRRKIYLSRAEIESHLAAKNEIVVKDDDVLYIEDAAEMFHISESTLKHRAKEGTLHFVKPPANAGRKKMYFSKKEIEATQLKGWRGETLSSARFIADICLVTEDTVKNWYDRGLIECNTSLRYKRVTQAGAEKFLDSLQVTGDWRTDEYCTIQEIMDWYDVNLYFVRKRIKEGKYRIGLKLPSGWLRLILSDVVAEFGRSK